MLQQAHADLDELDAAVRRIDDGTYGVCERCAAPDRPRRGSRPGRLLAAASGALRSGDPAGSGDEQAGAELGFLEIDELAVAFGPPT